MATTLELLREGRREQIWLKYCGFIDLSLKEFMDIQKRLLMEQVHFLSKCEWGRWFMGEQTPASVEAFRETVPLTTYKDYAPYFLEKDEGVLPSKPYWWLRTSGRSGQYPFKWAPYSEEMVQRLAECGMASLIFATRCKRGEFLFEERDVMFFALAPFPYLSGALAKAWEREFNFSFVPPMELAMEMGFQERISEGFRLALRTGIDAFNGLASVMAKIGEQFAEGGGSIEFSLSMLHPQVLARVIRAFIRSRLDGRKYLLPKDLWDVKCIGTGGADNRLFRDQVKEHWGKYPIEAYACTEGGIVAIQMWNGKGMTFFPDFIFLEFIPEDERAKWIEDPTYVPRTVLLDEVEAGKRYEFVMTNLLGGAMVRYRVGDLIEIVSLRDEETGINLPQMAFYARADDLIDLAGIARLTEIKVWEAVQAADFAYADWVARKEYEGTKVMMHLYIEPKEDLQADEIKRRVHGNLAKADHEYADLETMWDMDPLRVTVLSPGTIRGYYETQRDRGAELAHLKPPHMNPQDKVIDLLLAISAEKAAR